MYHFEVIGKKGNTLGVEEVPEEDVHEFITTHFYGQSIRFLAYLPATDEEGLENPPPPPLPENGDAAG